MLGMTLRAIIRSGVWIGAIPLLTAANAGPVLAQTALSLGPAASHSSVTSSRRATHHAAAPGERRVRNTAGKQLGCTPAAIERSHFLNVAGAVFSRPAGKPLLRISGLRPIRGPPLA